MDERSGRSWGEAKMAWDEVAKRFGEVGRRVGEQYRKLGDEAEPSAEAGGRAVGDAVREAVEELDHAFTSVGETLRDPQAKESLRQAVSVLGDALETTFAQIGQELRKHFGSGSTPPSTPDEPSGTSGSGTST
jgi:hypothetical protein